MSWVLDIPRPVLLVMLVILLWFQRRVVAYGRHETDVHPFPWKNRGKR